MSTRNLLASAVARSLRSWIAMAARSAAWAARPAASGPLSAVTRTTSTSACALYFSSEISRANCSARQGEVPTTLRRIAKLEADERDIKRRLTGRADYYRDDAGELKCRLVKPEGDYLERLQVRAATVADELAYWRQHVARQEAEGVKVWSAADFAKGDFVHFIGAWYEVLRVNAKSITIPAMISDGAVVTKANSRLSWTDTVPYHKVKGRKSAAEMASALAAVATPAAS